MSTQISKQSMSADWIEHPSDSACGRYWNPAIYSRNTKTVEYVGEDKVRTVIVHTHPTNTPRDVVIGYTPMSMFAKAHSSEISDVTLEIFKKHK